MLDKIISFIASAFAVKTKTIESTNSSITAVKRSGVIVVRFNGFTNLPAGWTTLGTLPEGWRPREELFMRPEPEKTLKLRINIRADGTILVYNYGTLIENAANAREIITFVGGGYCKGWDFNGLRFLCKIGGGVNVGQDSIIHRRLYVEDHKDHKDKPRDWRGQRTLYASRQDCLSRSIDRDNNSFIDWRGANHRAAIAKSEQRELYNLEQQQRIGQIALYLLAKRLAQVCRDGVSSNALVQNFVRLHRDLNIERGCLEC